MSFEGKTLLLTACLILFTTISTFDAFTLDGVVPLLQNHFDLNNAHTAWMKTISSTAATLVLLFMGIAGDRVGRRLLLLSAGFLWTIALCVSVLSGKGQYWLFIITRAAVSCGSAIFTVLVPVILADLYRDKGLGRAIMINYLMEIIGNIIAISFSSIIVSSSFPWWTPFLPIAAIGAFSTLSLVCLLPKELGYSTYENRNLLDALKLFRVKSYIFLTASAILTAWYSKVVFFWMATFVLSTWNYLPEVFYGLPYPVIMTTNAACELVGSLIGLPFWFWIAESWQNGRSCFSCAGPFARALPFIATFNGISLALSSIAMIWSSDVNYIIVAVGAFLAGSMGYSAISLTMQMTLSVCDARRRASALALQRFLSSLISIPGPQIIGAIADAFKGKSESKADLFSSYQKAFAINWLSILLSSFCLLMTVFFYATDEKNGRDPLRVRALSEKDPLLSRRQSRTVSVLEQSLMGRRATMESVRR